MRQSHLILKVPYAQNQNVPFVALSQERKLTKSWHQLFKYLRYLDGQWILRSTVVGCAMVGQLWVFRLRLWHCAAIKELTLRFLLGAKKAWAPWLVRGSSVQFSRSVVSDSATPWTAACQASLSITNSWSPPKPTSIELVMPSSHLILCRPFLLLPSVFPSLRVFSNESALHISRPKREPEGYIITATSRMNSVLVTQLKILDSSRFGVWVS